MKDIKYKFWSGTRMFTDLINVMECLKQQVSGTYDHVGLHGAAFPQYIGLRGKNSVEIYEGDIIKDFDGDGFHYVKYFEDSFVLCRAIDGKNRCPDRLEWWDKLEVIGNIYENEELSWVVTCTQ